MDVQLTFLKTYPGLSGEMPENHKPPVCEVTITNATYYHEVIEKQSEMSNCE